jgi:hypothetical protein
MIFRMGKTLRHGCGMNRRRRNVPGAGDVQPSMTSKSQPAAAVVAFTFAAALLFLTGHAAEAQVPGGGEVVPRRGGPGTGNPDEHLAPWRFLEKGAPMATGPVVLYWLPASREEMDRSPLRTSRPLLEAELRCVMLLAIVPDDAAAIEKLGATGRLPSAVLVNSTGAVVRRVENVHGVLRPATVEKMVSDELSVRDEAMFRDMEDARKRTAAGDSDGAIRLYRRIWDDRCLFPLAGTEAQRALKTLGVIVVEVPKPLAADPGLHPPPPPTIAPRKPAADKRPDPH